MNLTKNGVTISFDDNEIIRMALERLTCQSVPAAMGPAIAPRIGEAWPGQAGIYAGVARGRGGAADHHLIVGPERDATATWDDAMKWAVAVSVDGKTDFSLPTRKEQALLFANVSELFKEEYYWSDEQHASDSDYAWGQDFDGGGQFTWGKDDFTRARAVRRLVIQ